MDQGLVDDAINYHGPGLVDTLHDEQVSSNCALIQRVRHLNMFNLWHIQVKIKFMNNYNSFEYNQTARGMFRMTKVKFRSK